MKDEPGSALFITMGVKNLKHVFTVAHSSLWSNRCGSNGGCTTTDLSPGLC